MGGKGSDQDNPTSRAYARRLSPTSLDPVNGVTMTRSTPAAAPCSNESQPARACEDRGREWFGCPGWLGAQAGNFATSGPADSGSCDMSSHPSL